MRPVTPKRAGVGAGGDRTPTPVWHRRRSGAARPGVARDFRHDGSRHRRELRPESSLDNAVGLGHNWHTMSTGETERPRPLFWIGSALRDLKAFPPEVRQEIGFALYQAQLGRKHRDAKVLQGFGGAGVLEVVSDHDGDTFRAVYTARFAGAVYALHAFQKKSKRGIKTPPGELEVVRRRLKKAEEDHAKRRAEEARRDQRDRDRSE
jgi:phage-related protein